MFDDLVQSDYHQMLLRALVGWRLEAIACRLEAIASRLEAIAIGVEAIAINIHQPNFAVSLALLAPQVLWT